MSENNLESLYTEAQKAIKARDHNRAADLLRQILVIDENYKDSSRLLARIVTVKRRRWYNDIRIGWTLGVLLLVGLGFFIAPKISSYFAAQLPTQIVNITKTPAPAQMFLPTSTAVPLTWKRNSIGLELPRDVITAIVIDPKDSDVVYVGTENAGIYRSIDGGISWRPIQNGLKHANIQSLLIDPLDPKILYAGATPNSGIYKTTDGGEHWQAAAIGILRDGDTKGGFLLMDPTNNQHLYFASERSLYTTEDQGRYWALVKSEETCPYQFTRSQSLVVDPLDGKTLYASQWSNYSQGCPGGVYKSADGGNTWALTRLQGEWIGSIFVDHNLQGNDLLFAMQWGTTNWGTQISSDGGNTWQQSSPLDCSALTLHPQEGVLAYCDRALVKTMDGGQTWETINKTNIGQVNAMAISPSNPAIIFIGGDSLFVSTDGGKTWQEHSNGLPARRFDIRVDPRDNSEIYAFPWHSYSLNTGPLYRLSESGQNWEILSEVGRGLLFDANGTTLYRYDEFLRRSTDKGLTWETLPLPESSMSERGWNRAFTNPIQAGMLYYIRVDGSIFLSTDGGTNWEDFSLLRTGNSLYGPSLSFGNEAKLLYLVAFNQAYHSPDGVHTWSQCPGDISESSLSDTRVVIDPRDSNHILIAQLGAGVMGSRDGCVSWQSKNTGLGSLNITPLVLDPNNPDTVYAGTEGGAFVSFDFGENWSEINEGLLGATVVYSIVVDKDSNVYAATPYGIFKLEGK
jgi:photosystem II stability/assembly factor-like uncharacterized protein